jgi:hypothetical protein
MLQSTRESRMTSKGDTHDMPQAFSTSRGLIVRRYAVDRKAEWDRLVRSGKNATFLFERDYMDYHSARFADHSLMIYQGGRLLALLPANQTPDGRLQSHGGLTYGGFVFGADERLAMVLEVFRGALEYLAAQGIAEFQYRRIPRFYNAMPDDEVDYALFLLEASLVRRDCALVIPQGRRIALSKRRCREIAKAKSAGVQITEGSDFAAFWGRVLGPRLQRRYGVNPVHSLEEITLLAGRFPDNIRQFSALYQGAVVAGITVYETPTVAHVQYSAVSDDGQRVGALDLLVDFLVNERYGDKQYFDFGISNENAGRNLNHGLLDWKEGFGARSAAHDFYVLDPRAFPLLDSALGPA